MADDAAPAAAAAAATDTPAAAAPTPVAGDEKMVGENLLHFAVFRYLNGIDL